MGSNPQEFGSLLSQAIHRIKISTGGLIQVIQDDLGYSIEKQGGSAIEYWRRGHVPGDYRDVEILAREIIRRESLGREWLERFLFSADFPLAEELCNELYPMAVDRGPEVVFNSIPAKPFKDLVGRMEFMDQLVSVLTDPIVGRIVSIDGMGGIGKSALAIEAAHVMQGDAFFDQVLWIGLASSGHDNDFTLEGILNEITTKLGLPELNRLPFIEKLGRLRTIFHQRRILVVLDNLDTAAVPQEQVVAQLHSILGLSRALLTSRRRFSGDLFSIHLPGFDSVEGRDFLFFEAGRRNVERVIGASHGELEKIVTHTGGSPLAMKLVVGQLDHLRLDVVLDHLMQAKPIRLDVENDEYINFYSFIFMPSWKLLSPNGQKLLLAMTHFPAELGGPLEALAGTTHLSEDILRASIDELWRLSFLEIGETSGVEDIQYYLHTLTRYFVFSELLNREVK